MTSPIILITFPDFNWLCTHRKDGKPLWKDKKNGLTDPGINVIKVHGKTAKNERNVSTVHLDEKQGQNGDYGKRFFGKSAKIHFAGALLGYIL